MPVLFNEGIVMELKIARNDQLNSGSYEKGFITKSECLWQADREAWSTDQPATAFLAKKLLIKNMPASEVATATTDGRNIYVNQSWSASLDEATRRFTHAHLVWHCAAGHFRPARGLDSRRWHLACDHEVNVVLMILGFAMPPQAVLFPACIGKSLPAVYAWLADNPLIDEEVSLDIPPWQTTNSRYGESETTSFAATPLNQYWQKQTSEVVRRYLDTPYLRPLVASWLTNHC